MKVKDVMTVNVAAVGKDATLKQVAELMVDRGVSGVPVVDEDHRVLGVVSEADIVLKIAAERPDKGGWLDRMFGLADVLDPRLGAATAGEAMSAPALTIEAHRPVAEAARRMVDDRVNRLPVVLDDKLVGIVTRADLVRSFTRSDADIWEELRNEVILGKLWIPPEDLDVTVAGGRVKIVGEVQSKALAEIVESFAWKTPGVVSVDCSELTWQTKDRTPLFFGARLGR